MDSRDMRKLSEIYKIDEKTLEVLATGKFYGGYWRRFRRTWNELKEKPVYSITTKQKDDIKRAIYFMEKEVSK